MSKVRDVLDIKSSASEFSITVGPEYEEPSLTHILEKHGVFTQALLKELEEFVSDACDRAAWDAAAAER